MPSDGSTFDWVLLGETTALVCDLESGHDGNHSQEVVDSERVWWTDDLVQAAGTDGGTIREHPPTQFDLDELAAWTVLHVGHLDEIPA